MSRGKLKEFGIELPVFPCAGPHLLPAVFDADCPDALDEQECRRATAEWVKFQSEAGLDVISDAGQYRLEEAGYLSRALGGFKPGGLVRVYGNKYRRRPVISGKVKWKGSCAASWWKFARGQTDRPVKGHLPGPYSLAALSLDSHYPDRRKAALAISREVRREAEALVKAGCRMIEIAEPALGMAPEELPLVIETVQALVNRLPAYFILHACYADLSRVYPGMLDIPVQNISLEMAASEMEFLDLLTAKPFSRDISLGVIDVKAKRAETADCIRARIKQGLGALKPGQTWVVPDCGMAGLAPEDARGRLKTMAEAVAAARQALSQRQDR